MVDCCVFVFLSLTPFLSFLFVYRSQSAGRRKDGGQQAEEEAVDIWSGELVRYVFIVPLFLFFSSLLLLSSIRRVQQQVDKGRAGRTGRDESGSDQRGRQQIRGTV